jgi:choice-of-anchor C domain-containing protein
VCVGVCGDVMTKGIRSLTAGGTAMRSALCLGVALASVLCVGAPVEAASIILNGSFEDGTNGPDATWRTLQAGNTDLTGWSISAGSIDWIGGLWQPHGGVRSVDLHGNSAGTLAQSFATDIGQQYHVSFWIAGNPDGLPVEKTVRVTSGDAAESFSFVLGPGIGRQNMGWEQRSFGFTALAATSTLTFFSTSSGVFYGAALDDVSVTAVPAPAVIGLLGGALVPLLLRRRRR